MVLTDLFLMVTGTSSRHVKSLAQEAELALKRTQQRHPLRREGEDHGKWVLLDYGDFVIHLFDVETRDYYELERLWADAPSIELELAVADV